MQLSNSFTIARPLSEVYQAFLRVEEIASCLPGSTLLGQSEPGTYEGEVKVRIGPLSVTYSGQFVVVHADDAAHRLRMRAKGRETRGAGNAEADIVATLVDTGDGTLVQIDTDLDIRGKVAQFGRGVIGEVTDGIMQAFARNLEQQLSAGGAPTGDASPTSDTAPRPHITASETPRQAAEARVAGSGEAPQLDAWALILRPMLKRHGGSIATVACSAIAAWLGARAGARGTRAPR